MTSKGPIARKLGGALVTVLLCTFVSACERINFDDPPKPVQRVWSEDVRLDDGSTMVVKRSVTFMESNSLAGDTYNAVETESTITFTGELAALPPWSQALLALVLYRDHDTKEWTVVATTTSCEVWSRRSEPRPVYWEFRLRPQGWQEVPLSSTSAERAANLFTGYVDASQLLPHVTVAMTQKRNADGRVGSNYLRVDMKMKIYCSHITPHSIDGR